MAKVRHHNRGSHIRAAIGNARVARPSSGVHAARPAPKVGLSAPRPQASHPSPQQTQQREDSVQARAQGGSTMPWDAIAQREVGEALTNEQNALNELGANWVGRETYYGFGANGANNPYSQAALLAKHHEWNERGILNSAGNQLYAGSTVNAHRQEGGRYTTSYNQLLQAYEAEKAAKDARRQGIESSYRSARDAAQIGAIQRAAELAPAPVAPPSSAAHPAPAPAPVVHHKTQNHHTRQNQHKRKPKRAIGNARKA